MCHRECATYRPSCHNSNGEHMPRVPSCGRRPGSAWGVTAITCPEGRGLRTTEAQARRVMGRLERLALGSLCGRAAVIAC
jgi:hypothetical protein